MANEQQAREALKNVSDPELAMNIIDLGLIYELKVDEPANSVFVKMTFTSPACPAGEFILKSVQEELKKLGFEKIRVEITFEPPWSPERMTEDARAELNIPGY